MYFPPASHIIHHPTKIQGESIQHFLTVDRVYEQNAILDFSRGVPVEDLDVPVTNLRGYGGDGVGPMNVSSRMGAEYSPLGSLDNDTGLAAAIINNGRIDRRRAKEEAEPQGRGAWS